MRKLGDSLPRHHDYGAPNSTLGRAPDIHPNNQAYHAPHTHSQAYQHHPHPHTQNPYHHYKSDELHNNYSTPVLTSQPPTSSSSTHYPITNGPYSNNYQNNYSNGYSPNYHAHTPVSSYPSPTSYFNYINGGERINGSVYPFANHYEMQEYHNYHNQDYGTYRTKSPRGLSDDPRSDGSTPGDLYQQFSDSEITVAKVRICIFSLFN